MAEYSQPQAETAPQSGAVFSMEEADVQRRFGGLERLYGVQGAARIRALTGLEHGLLLFVLVSL